MQTSFRIFFLCYIIVLFAVKAEAQNPDLSSPYQTIYNHLFYLQPDSYEPALAARSIYGPDLDLEIREKLAIKLKQILDGKGLFVDLNMVPTQTNYRDSSSRNPVFTPFEKYPKVYVEKINGNWYYSRTTVNSIDEIHQSVYPFGSDILMNLFPEVGHKKFLGLQLWQWLGLFILLILSFLIHQLLKRVLYLIIRSIAASKIKNQPDRKQSVRKAGKILSLLIITKLLLIAIPVLLLPVKTSQMLMIVLQIFIGVYSILLVLRVIDVMMIYYEKIAQATENTLDDQLMPIVSRLLKIFVILGGTFFILNVLNVNITALIAGISIGGLALALAAQDTVRNFIGSVMIFFDKPFQIGDWISFDGKEGTVEEVGMRSTRIRTFSNSILTVPNGKLTDIPIDNLGLRLFRRFKTDIGITYDTPPVLIEAFIDGIGKILVTHPGTKKDNFEVRLNSLGDFSLNILVSVFFDVKDWRSELRCKHEVLISIIRLAEELGVQFAFPTSTLHIDNFPGQESNSPNYDKDRANIDKKLAAFLEQVDLNWQKA